MSALCLRLMIVIGPTPPSNGAIALVRIAAEAKRFLVTAPKSP
ncbi:hypothetical protein RHECNPAF_12600121 [Rhizobium etli CNPAF512]|nr:hypothetical protein RHECNPAF_12600121 [Rhizobium etli CNPAF512]